MVVYAGAWSPTAMFCRHVQTALVCGLMLFTSAYGAARKQQVFIENKRSFTVKVPAAAAKFNPTKALLWLTANDGQEWILHSQDPTGKGPLQVSLVSDGRYGVAVGIVDSKGRTIGKPKQGRKPAVVFVVDSTKPTLAFTAPAARHVVKPGASVNLTWTASAVSYTHLTLPTNREV